jgi:hypothetical protein
MITSLWQGSNLNRRWLRIAEASGLICFELYRNPLVSGIRDGVAC